MTNECLRPLGLKRCRFTTFRLSDLRLSDFIQIYYSLFFQVYFENANNCLLLCLARCRYATIQLKVLFYPERPGVVAIARLIRLILPPKLHWPASLPVMLRYDLQYSFYRPARCFIQIALPALFPHKTCAINAICLLSVFCK